MILQSSENLESKIHVYSQLRLKKAACCPLIRTQPSSYPSTNLGNKDEHLETSYLLYHSEPGTIISHEP